MNKKVALTIASLVAAFGISAGSASSASAGEGACAGQGKKIFAHQNGETLTGTCGADTFIVGQYSTVFINAGGGNDTIKAGWGGGRVEVHGGLGNDTVYNGGDKQVFVWGEGGNDIMEGGVYADKFFGGSGTDQACVQAGDTKDSIETVISC
jgi:Ca2+-binding RTX toxin-like protein